METLRCKAKIRAKNGVIMTYRVIDSYGNVMDVDAEKLKYAILSGIVEVDNLTLTSDNRLVNSENRHSVKVDRTLNSIDDKYLKLQMTTKGDVIAMKMLRQLGETCSKTNNEGIGLSVLELGCDVNTKRNTVEVLMIFRDKVSERPIATAFPPFIKIKEHYGLTTNGSKAKYNIQCNYRSWSVGTIDEALEIMHRVLMEYIENKAYGVVKNDGKLIDHRYRMWAEYHSNNAELDSNILWNVGGQVVFRGNRNPRCEKIVIPEVVTVVYDNAFDGMKNLKTVITPDRYLARKVAAMIKEAGLSGVAVLAPR